MKLIFALAAAGFVSTLTVPTPASAQKDRIGIMYVTLAMIMLMRGFVDAMMMRTQQAIALNSDGYLPPEQSGLYGEMQPQQYSCRGRHAGAGHCPSRESLYRRLPQGSGRES